MSMNSIITKYAEFQIRKARANGNDKPLVTDFTKTVESVNTDRTNTSVVVAPKSKLKLGR